ncbi:hypothetical protein C8F04DRAFT_1260037 [Mycena alexandri]|uniref:Uncharacterized protein n=1 Tax=Mycena alexandri TaxID=1745969 RepID=A0AAD6SV00_9AGAR|nr:hypothetical protein C8F04DRAFT_1260037 [Mycena alexandri]
MSNQGQNRFERSDRNQEQRRLYTIQSFPEIPPGVAIMPFKDFQEQGIRPALDPGGIERDFLGIPTVELRVKHDTDVSKTNPDRHPTSARTFEPPLLRRDWWEDWAQDEHLHMHGPYDQTIPAVQRLRIASSHFQRFRRFPGNVFHALWESTFKIYAGIRGTTPVWQKASDPPYGEENISDDDFEDGGEKQAKFPPRVLPREPYELYDVRPPIVENDDQIRVLLDAARQKKDARAETFLADPAKAIQIFLSSYMVNNGLTLSDRNLVNAPHLLRFFVNFLLRNQVFTEDTCVDSLKRAVDVIDLASSELPLTSTISKALPDEFSAACQNCWGSSVDGYLAATVDPFESALLAENIEIVKSEDVLAQDADATIVDEGGWSSTTPAIDWQPTPSATLVELFGPTTLPLTHAAGAVEQSVRRILSISRPLDETNNTSAVAEEHTLLTRMCAVEMGPWLDCESDDTTPTILRAGNKSHALENRITMMVEPKAAEHLRVGMGIAGVWVQLTRLSDEGDSQPSEDLWFLEKLTSVLPSYWIV